MVLLLLHMFVIVHTYINTHTHIHTYIPIYAHNRIARNVMNKTNTHTHTHTKINQNQPENTKYSHLHSELLTSPDLIQRHYMYQSSSVPWY
jgi:hypothetical protein